MDFNRAETDLTEGSIKSFDWEILLLVKNVHKQNILCNKTASNIFHNFTAHIIICDNKDPPLGKL